MSDNHDGLRRGLWERLGPEAYWRLVDGLKKHIKDKWGDGAPENSTRRREMAGKPPTDPAKIEAIKADIRAGRTNREIIEAHHTYSGMVTRLRKQVAMESTGATPAEITPAPAPVAPRVEREPERPRLDLIGAAYQRGYAAGYDTARREMLEMLLMPTPQPVGAGLRE